MSARSWRPQRALLIAALVGCAGSAAAWDSRCRVGGKDCAPGPETARRRWNAPDGEHFLLWNSVLGARGVRLPAHLSGVVSLKVPTVQGPKVTPLIGNASPTVAPRPFTDATTLVTREYAVAELAQLPDLSWALWDWAQGNETCPIDASTPIDACHAFASHMGALNSNHFPPQVQHFWRYYHDLALARARDCASLRAALPAQYVSFAEACDQEAFSFEAVAQHYLQDAWSTGHMWERWGGPDVADFGGADWRPRALLVAMTSGLIHGARGVLQEQVAWAGGKVDVADPMCAPLDPASNAYSDPLWPTLPPPSYVYAADGSTQRGVGDLYLSSLTGPYGAQYGALIDCAVSSVIEVADTAGLPSVGTRAGSAPGAANFAAECFQQRATNGTLYLGAGVDTVVTPLEPIDLPVVGRITTDTHLRVELDGRIGSRTTPTPLIDRIPGPVKDLLPDNWKQILAKTPGEVVRDILVPEHLRRFVPPDSTVSDVVVILAQHVGALSVPDPLKVRFRNDLAALGPVIKARAALDPGGTSLAQGGLPPLLGVTSNGTASFQHDPPAQYVDPRPPYSADVRATVTGNTAKERGTILARAYHRAHVRDWCESMSAQDLEALRSGPAANCAVCEEFAARHLRIGDNAGSYDTAREPVCNYLVTNPAYVYEPVPAGTSLTEEQAVANWCGCGTSPAPLTGCTGAFGGNVVAAATRQPIGGAVAAFRSPMASGQLTSASDGTFLSDAIACGSFGVEISAPGFVPATATFDINEPGTTTQLVELDAIDDDCASAPADLAGAVRDATTGTLIPDAIVEMREGFSPRPSDAVFQGVVTDATGAFQFASLDSGYYALSASADGYEPSGLRSASLCGKGQERDLQLLPKTAPPLKFVLDWARPDDMDLHLLLPSGEEVGFAECSGSLSGPPYASLDVDHQAADGPEAISIARFSPGSYVLYVHNYSAQNDGASSFVGSEASVVVYRDGKPSQSFAVPTSGGEYFWDVLQIDSDGSDFELTTLNALTNNRANPHQEGDYEGCRPLR
ncbi:MAG TPA: carboxypeptidase regulatory-like domain-containing protein [Polyangiaceae bacterium]|nr:carboxypeptidase regulatory-like domain-containing protein [Polyangiaceae bacterium]